VPIPQTLFIVSLTKWVWRGWRSSINIHFLLKKGKYDINNDNESKFYWDKGMQFSPFWYHEKNLLPKTKLSRLSFTVQADCPTDLRYKHFIKRQIVKSFWSENQSPCLEGTSQLTHLIQTVTLKKIRKLSRFCFGIPQSTVACFLFLLICIYATTTILLKLLFFSWGYKRYTQTHNLYQPITIHAKMLLYAIVMQLGVAMT